MGFKRNHSITVIFFFILLTIFAARDWRVQEQFYYFYYLLTQENENIDEKQEFEKLLNTFKQIEYKDLPEEYKSYTKTENSKYKPLLENKNYYCIQRKDFFKKIVGPITVRELISKDKYYKSCIKNGNQDYMWLISTTLLNKLFDLRTALEKADHNPNGFSITNGHRHPKYNEDIGGASKSRHIQGEAIDLHIGDINKSGRYEKEDKQIVLDLLENEIIGSEGGIGRYPGTRAVHFDVRGYKARWDKQ